MGRCRSAPVKYVSIWCLRYTQIENISVCWTESVLYAFMVSAMEALAATRQIEKGLEKHHKMREYDRRRDHDCGSGWQLCADGLEQSFVARAGTVSVPLV